MKGIIRFLMWILIILLLLIVASFFLPRTVKVERSKKIAATPKIVFNQINDLHNWDKWSVWHQKDPDMTVDYSNHGIGEGAEYYWKSTKKDVGEGIMKITQSILHELVVIDLSFLENGKAKSNFSLEEQNDSTYVTWGFTFDTKYNPVSRWMGLFMDKMIEKDYEEGLKNLKTVAEMQTQRNTYYIEVGTLEGFDYLAKRVTTSKDSIGAAMEKIYTELYGFIMKNNIPIAGVPFSIYHNYSNLGVDVESGIPIGMQITGNSDLIGGKMEQKNCAVLDYYGAYDNLPNAYKTLEKWVNIRDFKVIGQPIERYLTDMQKEKDPSKWHTKIYFPIDK